jgi:2-[(L-alanin-3-ylcarbamoyl)methyl]-2-hydroxybutanedioate decarboxylase
MALPDQARAALLALDSPACAYVYDRATLRERAAALRAALPGVTVLYAVKANGRPEVAQTMAAACHGLEVASGGELAVAVAAGARRIVFGGPAKTDAELRSALAAGAQVNVESAQELRRLADLAARGRAGKPVDIAVRVNRAGSGLSGSHAMTGTPTPFGVDEEQLPQLLELAGRLPSIRVTGWHLHAVSNNLDAAAHSAFATDALDWSAAAAAAYGFELRTVNLGGGFGIDYTGDREFDLSALSVTPPPGVEVIVEPGRWLAADAGWYAAEVIDLKQTHGRWFAVLRGGTHHYRLPAAWGFSAPFTVLPVERWPYGWERPTVADVEVDAVGELCTPRDVLSRGQHVDRLRVGDLLVFGRTGAYGWDISHHDFLRHPYPEMIFVN